jgi:aconitate hydratase
LPYFLLSHERITAFFITDTTGNAVTAANKGILTPATEFDGDYGKYKYHFDSKIYANRVFDSKGVADPEAEIVLGPNIKDWPEMSALPENLMLRVVSEIHDPVTTTDELIPSGETSSYRSNPHGLAEFTLSRKDPAYVGRAKQLREAQTALMAGKCPADACPELSLAQVFDTVKKAFPDFAKHLEASCQAQTLDSVLAPRALGFGSTIFAVKPGDGSAREQAASCQKVLGGWANIANEYATKRYRSNLINWGMLPFVIEEGALPFANLDYLYIPGIRKAVEEKTEEITAYAVKGESLAPFTLRLGDLTDEERQIILKGCLINYNRV